MKNKIFNHIKILFIIAVILVVFIVIFMTINNRFKYKNKLYELKVETIENSAREYGLNNKSLIIKGTSTINDVESTITINSFNEDNTIKEITYNTNKKYNTKEQLGKNEYRATRMYLKDLADLDIIKYDKIDNCSNCTAENKEYYNNIIVNPKTNNIMNSCYVYIYYKDSDIYAHFDSYSCNKVDDNKNLNGNEYKMLANK